MTGERRPIKSGWLADITEEQREELGELIAKFDDAAAEFDADHNVIFSSDAERKRLYFGSVKRWSKAWSRPAPCMHDGCSKTSIARSHTVSLSASLRLIAENGHVVTPRFGKNGIEIVPIGINEASTFPGFCEEHEAQFSVFETTKEMNDPTHFYLQAYRTICREIYAMRHNLKRGEDMLTEYRRKRNEYFVARLAPAHKGADPLQVREVSFKDDPVETELAEMLAGLRLDLPELEGLYHSILDDLQNDKETIALNILTFDMQLPVSLSGLGVLNYTQKSARKRALCFLAIIPETGCTKIMLGATGEHKDALEQQFEDNSSPSLLEMLESWMVNGSDHWFMTPSDWAAIPHERQRAICDGIRDLLSIGHREPFSILDGPRRHIVGLIENHLGSGEISPEEVEQLREVLVSERAKLDYLVPAPSSTSAR